MDSEPPSFVPPPSSDPPRPGTASYRSSSAPTTSVAPPPLPPQSPLWPIVRLLLSLAMLLLSAQAAANQDPEAKGLLVNALPCLLIALGMAVPPMILTRYRSLRMFSWLLLIAAFFQLYARRDGLLGASVAVTALHATHV